MSQSLFTRGYQRVARDYFRWQYNRTAKGIVNTPPIPRGGMPFILLSMVHQRDVFSYLVAVKSFTRYTNPSRIVMVCDPSIQETDRALVLLHIPHIELRNADDFTHADIPRGGTWERLYAISIYLNESYVVQLDADTITLHPNTFVRDCIEKSIGFVLGEIADQKVLTLSEAAIDARNHIAREGGNLIHIQAQVEAVLDKLALPPLMRYVRGCSGFTGFPKDDTVREKLLHFSKKMGKHFGESWKKWGTEQITSNYLIASYLDTKILPFPDYGTPDVACAGSVFIHFIGSMRFINWRYQRATKRFIDFIGQKK